MEYPKVQTQYKHIFRDKLYFLKNFSNFSDLFRFARTWKHGKHVSESNKKFLKQTCLMNRHKITKL